MAEQQVTSIKTPRNYGSHSLLPEFTTVIGIASGLSLVGYAIYSGGGVSTFINVSALMITLGGTIAATFISFSTAEIVNIIKVLLNVFRTQLRKPEEIVKAVTQLAMVSRRGGNLVLEKEEKKIGDSYLRKSISYIVDGVDEEIISDYMLAEIESTRLRHESGQRIFRTMGMFAPAFGLIGTIIGLVQMLNTLDDPSNIGPAMAVALITTFYGAMLSNLFFIPIAEKLKSRTDQEIFLMQIIYTGIISLRRFQAPRVIEKKLNSFVQAKKRVITKNI